MRTLLFLLALLVLPAAAQARLSPEERRMVAAVDAEQARTIALLERLVNRNSGTLNLEQIMRKFKGTSWLGSTVIAISNIGFQNFLFFFV